MKNYFLLASLAIITLFNSCSKDEMTFFADPGITYKSNILGIVSDESNQPVEGANVTFNGLTKTTDKNGVYQFKDVEVSSKHSFLKIRKAGYFEGSRAFNTQKPANIRLINTLLKKTFDNSFASDKGGLVEANNCELNFPADAIVIESSGAQYNGTVKVAVQHLDPSLSSTFDRMPGNLSGVNAPNDEVKALTTYGMLFVELQSSTGEKLQIKPGKQVSLSARVPTTMVPNAPATIAMWYFDEAIGYWREEGSAVLNPQNGTYTGNVSHFSIWNYDDPSPSINVSGKVVDSSGNPLICQIRFFSNNVGGYGQTNYDGTYSGPIAKDKVLTLEIIYYGGNCAGKIFKSLQVGPFSGDVVIPDITISISSGELFEFTADVNNCAGALVLNGYARIYDIYGFHYFPIDNGHVEGSILSCYYPIIESLSFVDSDNSVESGPVILNGPGPHNLGTQIACGNQAEGWSMKNDSIGFDEVHGIAYVMDSFPNTIFQSKPITLPIEVEFAILEYNDGDGDPNIFTPGIFNLQKGGFFYIPTNTNYQVKGGSITVTQGGVKGDLFKANYSAFVQKSGTVFSNTVTGSIIWTIK